MGWKQKIGIAFAAALLLGACGGENNGPIPDAETPGYVYPRDAGSAGGILVHDSPVDAATLSRGLEEIADLERSGLYTPGMGLAESGLRENAGDYAGAVAAAYKELAWAYGRGIIQKDALEQGLGNVLALKETGGGEDAVRAAEGILAFMQGQWDECAVIFRSLFEEGEEPDGFVRWMILVCALEKNRDDRQAGAAYRAIRARYAQFPEYWYRGARAFAGAVAVKYAERCISLVPDGPFAGECRNILASLTGLRNEDSSFLKSKFEIEELISLSLNQGNPDILAPLIPLISLPDNPYTIYAMGALRALAAVPKYRDYFSALVSGSGGRLAERLAYICRG